MDSFDNIYKRILYVSNSETQMELASVLNISQSSISDAKRRKSIPSDWLVKLYDKFGVNPDWIRYNKEPLYMRSLPELGKNSGSLLHEDTENLGFIAPVFNTKCEVESGKIIFSTISETLLPKSLEKCSDLVFKYDAIGMEPIISKNSILGVSTLREANKLIPVTSGEIYAVHSQMEGIIFRRIVQDFDSENCLLCFEDKKLPPIKLSFSILQKVLIGKVSWVLHTY